MKEAGQMDQMQNLLILLLVDTTWWGGCLETFLYLPNIRNSLAHFLSCYPGRMWDLAEDR